MRLRKPSPALLISLLALFVALGGSSYAALTLPKASVGAKQLKKNAVTSPKVKPGSLLLSDFRASQRAGLVGPRGPEGPQGVQGVKGVDGAPGAPGATNVTRRIGALTNIGADGSGTATSACDPGERAVGGGGIAWNGTTLDFDLISSYPTFPGGAPADVGVPTGWSAAYVNRDSNNDNAGAIDVRAWVVCAAP
jgi:hypothetical protein